MNTYLQSFFNQIEAIGFPKLDLDKCYDEAYRTKTLKAKHISEVRGVAIRLNVIGEGVRFSFYGHEDNILREISVYTYDDTETLYMTYDKVDVEADEATKEISNIVQGRKFTEELTKTFDSVSEALWETMAILVLDGRIIPPFKS